MEWKSVIFRRLKMFATWIKYLQGSYAAIPAAFIWQTADTGRTNMPRPTVRIAYGTWVISVPPDFDEDVREYLATQECKESCQVAWSIDTGSALIIDTPEISFWYERRAIFWIGWRAKNCYSCSANFWYFESVRIGCIRRFFFWHDWCVIVCDICYARHHANALGCNPAGVVSVVQSSAFFRFFGRSFLTMGRRPIKTEKRRMCWLSFLRFGFLFRPGAKRRAALESLPFVCYVRHSS